MTRGASSGTRATDLAGRDRQGDEGRDRDRPHAHPRRPRLARPPARPARHRQAHRRGRLLGAARLLDRRAPRTADRLELTVQRLDDGEVSPYLAGIAEPGDQFELRGPIGGWFAWRTDDPRPLLLLAGGSGIVPLMSMIRTHEAVKSQASVRLIYSARTPADVIYADELSRTVPCFTPHRVTYLYTRLTRWRKTPAKVTPDSGHQRAEARRLFSRHPANQPRPGLPPVHGYAGRLSADVLAKTAFPPELQPGRLRLRPVRLRRGGLGPAGSGGLSRGQHQDGTLRPDRLAAATPRLDRAPGCATSDGAVIGQIRERCRAGWPTGTASPGSRPRRPRRCCR